MNMCLSLIRTLLSFLYTWQQLKFTPRVLSNVVYFSIHCSYKESEL